jgi:MFS family permease
MNGYDGSVMGSINAMDTWHNYFGIGKTGSGIGLVTAIYPVGQVSGSFFAGLILDNFGRKVAMFIGACFIIIGSVVQATTANQNLNQFIGGRYLVGFGVPICVTAAPTYLVEMAYPTWRGLAGGAYNVFGWYLGAISRSSP